MVCSASAVVCLTREEGKNKTVEDELRRRLPAGKADVREVPMVFTEAMQEGHEALVEFLASKESRGTISYVAITSPEAMAQFLRAYQDAGAPAGTALACVGAGTQKALDRAGLPNPPDVAFVPTRATAKDLAAELPLQAPGARVLYPASARAKTELQDGLAARGCEVVRINTYTTVAATLDKLTDEQAANARAAAVACFASPSAAMAWADAFGTESTLAACIGKTSYDACVRLGWRADDVFCPDAPGLDGFADAVEQAWARAVQHV